MMIASWNVNSLRVRLPHVLDWLADTQADVLGLQELKLTDDKFPHEELTAAGYHSVCNGQPTYNGVALLSKEEPTDVSRNLPDFDDPQRRVIAATYGDTRVVNLYVPNGQSVGSEKYSYKLDWFDSLIGYLQAEQARYPRLVVMGDFNIAPDDRDVHDPEEWRGKILCSDPERERLQTLAEQGLTDSFRQFEQDEAVFSWWDYRAAGFRRNRGLRIDLLLISPPLQALCTESRVDKEPRKLERPSDHAPVYLRLAG